jgi:hypothetical protein
VSSWEETVDESGNIYYINKITGNSTWEIPKSISQLTPSPSNTLRGKPLSIYPSILVGDHASSSPESKEYDDSTLEARRPAPLDSFDEYSNFAQPLHVLTSPIAPQSSAPGEYYV